MPKSTAELRLPTLPVAVQIAVFGDAEPMSAELYVPDLPRQGRSQLVDDLSLSLDGDAGFLPVKTGDAVTLLGKHAIVWVAIAAGGDPKRAPTDGDWEDASGAPEPSEVLTLYDNKHDVEVILTGGASLAGSILYSSPADRTRVIDHLNRRTRFLRLWTSRAQYLINKQHVVRVRELEG
jgi:hypothetical protein